MCKLGRHDDASSLSGVLFPRARGMGEERGEKWAWPDLPTENGRIKNTDSEGEREKGKKIPPFPVHFGGWNALRCALALGSLG